MFLGFSIFLIMFESWKKVSLTILYFNITCCGTVDQKWEKQQKDSSCLYDLSDCLAFWLA